MRLGRARLPIAVMTAMLCVSAMVLLVAPPAGATHVSPELSEGAANQTCSDFAGEGQTWVELKVDPPADGVFTDGTLSVTITNFNDLSFDWSSNIGVDAVFVKSGSSGSHLYRYDPPSEATSDTGLTTPGSVQEISHISFCYDIDEATTSTTEATTSTTEATTSTTEATTSTTEATTSTTEATTTTVDDEVLGTTLTTTTSTTVADEVLDTVVSPSTLPFTGANSGGIAMLGMALVAMGALALVTARGVKD